MEKKEKKRVYSARRNKYRKLKIGVLYTVMILAILTAGIAIGATVLFKIDTIQVVGESRYDPQEIILWLSMSDCRITGISRKRL